MLAQYKEELLEYLINLINLINLIINLIIILNYPKNHNHNTYNYLHYNFLLIIFLGNHQNLVFSWNSLEYLDRHLRRQLFSLNRNLHHCLPNYFINYYFNYLNYLRLHHNYLRIHYYLCPIENNYYWLDNYQDYRHSYVTKIYLCLYYQP